MQCLLVLPGTPLLKQDKQTSMEVFGSYIHTYKFNEAVEDEVVLDLMYEARDIEQRLTSQEKIDTWFESKTKGLNDFQKSEIQEEVGHHATGAQFQKQDGADCQ
jgi:type I restriction enzyme, R subunit